jgi:hypothetical protein
VIGFTLKMSGKAKETLRGKTYSLLAGGTEDDAYYETIRGVTDYLLKEIPGEQELLDRVKALNRKRPRIGKGTDELIIGTLKKSLSAYTLGVSDHIKGLPLRKRFDDVLTTREGQYHLYMVEIELVNRLYRDEFKRSSYKFALIAHCLRDFREKCEAQPGDIEAVCRHCTKECFINLGSVLLKKYGIHPYISVEMDQEKLLGKLKSKHPSIGGLGVACVPELAHGMRLCIKLGIAPVGIPLDANRCARWMGKARETTYSLKELEALLK